MAAEGRRPSISIRAQADPRQSFRLLQNSHQKRAHVDLKLCNAVLSSFAKGGYWRESLQLLAQLSSWGVQPDAVSMSMAFSAMKEERPWQNALYLLESLAVVPDTIAMNTLMSLLPWRSALRLSEAGLPEMRIAADQVTYNALLNAMDAGKKWQMALNILESMPSHRVVPDLTNCNTAMKVCSHSGQWQWALSLFHELPEPNDVSFITAISACPGGQWPLALDLLAKSSTTVAIRSAALQVLASAGLWETALQILTTSASTPRPRSPRDFDVAQVLKAAVRAGQDMRPMIRALNGQRFSYNTVLEEFSQLGQWQQSLDLLSGMISSRVQPDEYSYGLCIGSCDTSGAWHLALRLLGVMPARTLTPQLKTYQVAAGVCAHAGEWRAVLRLIEMLDREDADRVVSWALEVCYLRGHSLAAAQLALQTSSSSSRREPSPSQAEEVRSRYLMAMQTCVSCREWPLVMDLFERLPEVRVTTNGILKELVQPGFVLPPRGGSKTSKDGQSPS